VRTWGAISAPVSFYSKRTVCQTAMSWALKTSRHRIAKRMKALGDINFEVQQTSIIEALQGFDSRGVFLGVH